MINNLSISVKRFNFTLDFFKDACHANSYFKSSQIDQLTIMYRFQHVWLSFLCVHLI